MDWLFPYMEGAFKSSMEPYINTEILSQKYRMLGAKIGSRVNIDYFQITEFDLLQVQTLTLTLTLTLILPRKGWGWRGVWLERRD